MLPLLLLVVVAAALSGAAAQGEFRGDVRPVCYLHNTFGENPDYYRVLTSGDLNVGVNPDTGAEMDTPYQWLQESDQQTFERMREAAYSVDGGNDMFYVRAYGYYIERCAETRKQRRTVYPWEVQQIQGELKILVNSEDTRVAYLAPVFEPEFNRNISGVDFNWRTSVEPVARDWYVSGHPEDVVRLQAVLHIYYNLTYYPQPHVDRHAMLTQERMERLVFLNLTLTSDVSSSFLNNNDSRDSFELTLHLPSNVSVSRDDDDDDSDEEEPAEQGRVLRRVQVQEVDRSTEPHTPDGRYQYVHLYGLRDGEWRVLHRTTHRAECGYVWDTNADRERWRLIVRYVDWRSQLPQYQTLRRQLQCRRDTFNHVLHLMMWFWVPTNPFNIFDDWWVLDSWRGIPYNDLLMAHVAKRVCQSKSDDSLSDASRGSLAKPVRVRRSLADPQPHDDEEQHPSETYVDEEDDDDYPHHVGVWRSDHELARHLYGRSPFHEHHETPALAEHRAKRSLPDPSEDEEEDEEVVVADPRDALLPMQWDDDDDDEELGDGPVIVELDEDFQFGDDDFHVYMKQQSGETARRVLSLLVSQHTRDGLTDAGGLLNLTQQLANLSLQLPRLYTPAVKNVSGGGVNLSALAGVKVRFETRDRGCPEPSWLDWFKAKLGLDDPLQYDCWAPKTVRGSDDVERQLLPGPEDDILGPDMDVVEEIELPPPPDFDDSDNTDFENLDSEDEAAVAKVRRRRGLGAGGSQDGDFPPPPPPPPPLPPQRGNPRDYPPAPPIHYPHRPGFTPDLKGLTHYAHVLGYDLRPPGDIEQRPGQRPQLPIDPRTGLLDPRYSGTRWLADNHHHFWEKTSPPNSLRGSYSPPEGASARVNPFGGKYSPKYGKPVGAKSRSPQRDFSSSSSSSSSSTASLGSLPPPMSPMKVLAAGTRPGGPAGGPIVVRSVSNVGPASGSRPTVVRSKSSVGPGSGVAPKGFGGREFHAVAPPGGGGGGGGFWPLTQANLRKSQEGFERGDPLRDSVRAMVDGKHRVSVGGGASGGGLQTRKSDSNLGVRPIQEPFSRGDVGRKPVRPQGGPPVAPKPALPHKPPIAAAPKPPVPVPRGGPRIVLADTGLKGRMPQPHSVQPDTVRWLFSEDSYKRQWSDTNPEWVRRMHYDDVDAGAARGNSQRGRAQPLVPPKGPGAKGPLPPVPPQGPGAKGPLPLPPGVHGPNQPIYAQIMKHKKGPVPPPQDAKPKGVMGPPPPPPPRPPNVKPGGGLGPLGDVPVRKSFGYGEFDPLDPLNQDNGGGGAKRKSWADWAKKEGDPWSGRGGRDFRRIDPHRGDTPRKLWGQDFKPADSDAGSQRGSDVGSERRSDKAGSEKGSDRGGSERGSDKGGSDRRGQGGGGGAAGFAGGSDKGSQGGGGGRDVAGGSNRGSQGGGSDRGGSDRRGQAGGGSERGAGGGGAGGAGGGAGGAGGGAGGGGGGSDKDSNSGGEGNRGRGSGRLNIHKFQVDFDTKPPHLPHKVKWGRTHYLPGSDGTFNGPVIDQMRYVSRVEIKYSLGARADSAVKVELKHARKVLRDLLKDARRYEVRNPQAGWSGVTPVQAVLGPEDLGRIGYSPEMVQRLARGGVVHWQAGPPVVNVDAKGRFPPGRDSTHALTLRTMYDYGQSLQDRLRMYPRHPGFQDEWRSFERASRDMIEKVVKFERKYPDHRSGWSFSGKHLIPPGLKGPDPSYYNPLKVKFDKDGNIQSYGGKVKGWKPDFFSKEAGLYARSAEGAQVAASAGVGPAKLSDLQRRWAAEQQAADPRPPSPVRPGSAASGGSGGSRGGLANRPLPPPPPPAPPLPPARAADARDGGARRRESSRRDGPRGYDNRGYDRGGERDDRRDRGDERRDRDRDRSRDRDRDYRRDWDRDERRERGRDRGGRARSPERGGGRRRGYRPPPNAEGGFELRYHDQGPGADNMAGNPKHRPVPRHLYGSESDVRQPGKTSDGLRRTQSFSGYDKTHRSSRWEYRPSSDLGRRQSFGGFPDAEGSPSGRSRAYSYGDFGKTKRFSWYQSLHNPSVFKALRGSVDDVLNSPGASPRGNHLSVLSGVAPQSTGTLLDTHSGLESVSGRLVTGSVDSLNKVLGDLESQVARLPDRAGDTRRLMDETRGKYEQMKQLQKATTRLRLQVDAVHADLEAVPPVDRDTQAYKDQLRKYKSWRYDLVNNGKEYGRLRDGLVDGVNRLEEVIQRSQRSQSLGDLSEPKVPQGRPRSGSVGDKPDGRRRGGLSRADRVDFMNKVKKVSGVDSRVPGAALAAVQAQGRRGSSGSSGPVAPAGPAGDQMGFAAAFVISSMSQMLTQGVQRDIDAIVHNKYAHMSKTEAVSIQTLEQLDKIGSQASMTGMMFAMMGANPAGMVVAGTGLGLQALAGIVTFSLQIYQTLNPKPAPEDPVLHMYREYAKRVNSRESGNAWCLMPETKLQVTLQYFRESPHRDVPEGKALTLWASMPMTKIIAAYHPLIMTNYQLRVRCAEGQLRFENFNIEAVAHQYDPASNLWQVNRIGPMVAMEEVVRGQCGETPALEIHRELIDLSRTTLLRQRDTAEPPGSETMDSDVCDVWPFKKFYVHMESCRYEPGVQHVGWTTCGVLFKHSVWNPQNGSWAIVNPFARPNSDRKVFTFTRRDFRTDEINPLLDSYHRRLCANADQPSFCRLTDTFELTDTRDCHNKIRWFRVRVGYVEDMTQGHVQGYYMTCPLGAVVRYVLKNGHADNLLVKDVDLYGGAKKFMFTNRREVAQSVLWIYCQHGANEFMKSDVVEVVPFDKDVAVIQEHRRVEHFDVVEDNKVFEPEFSQSVMYNISKRGPFEWTNGPITTTPVFEPDNLVIREDFSDVSHWTPVVAKPVTLPNDTVTYSFKDVWDAKVLDSHWTGEGRHKWWTYAKQGCKATSSLQLTLSACAHDIRGNFKTRPLGWFTWSWVDQKPPKESGQTKIDPTDVWTFKPGQDWVHIDTRSYKHLLKDCKVTMALDTREITFDCPQTDVRPEDVQHYDSVCLTVSPARDKCEREDTACGSVSVEWSDLPKKRNGYAWGLSYQSEMHFLWMVEKQVWPNVFCADQGVYSSELDYTNRYTSITVHRALDRQAPLDSGFRDGGLAGPRDIRIKAADYQRVERLQAALDKLYDMKNDPLVSAINQFAGGLSRAGKNITKVDVSAEYLVQSKEVRDAQIQQLLDEVDQVSRELTLEAFKRTQFYYEMVERTKLRCCLLALDQDYELSVRPQYPDSPFHKCSEPETFTDPDDDRRVWGPQYAYESRFDLRERRGDRPWAVCVNAREIIFENDRVKEDFYLRLAEEQLEDNATHTLEDLQRGLADVVQVVQEWETDKPRDPTLGDVTYVVVLDEESNEWRVYTEVDYDVLVMCVALGAGLIFLLVVLGLLVAACCFCGRRKHSHPCVTMRFRWRRFWRGGKDYSLKAEDYPGVGYDVPGSSELHARLTDWVRAGLRPHSAGSTMPVKQRFGSGNRGYAGSTLSSSACSLVSATTPALPERDERQPGPQQAPATEDQPLIRLSVSSEHAARPADAVC